MKESNDARGCEKMLESNLKIRERRENYKPAPKEERKLLVKVFKTEARKELRKPFNTGLT
jgi:hypothetical protein